MAPGGRTALTGHGDAPERAGAIIGPAVVRTADPVPR